jgi:hypothetical protein
MVDGDISDNHAHYIVLGPNCFRQTFAKLRAAGRDVLTVNRAFIGSVLGNEENPYVAIGWNGYNNHARFPFEYGAELPYSRAVETLWREVHPASQRTGPALILGEYDTPPEFIHQTLQDCAALGIDAWFRPHPNAQHRPRLVRLCPEKNLKGAIRSSSVALTHHSTAACEALLRGLPVVVYDSESMCAPVCPEAPYTETTSLVLPDRTQWVEWLAWTQWTVDEIHNGEPWSWLL